MMAPHLAPMCGTAGLRLALGVPRVWYMPRLSPRDRTCSRRPRSLGTCGQVVLDDAGHPAGGDGEVLARGYPFHCQPSGSASRAARPGRSGSRRSWSMWSVKACIAQVTPAGSAAGTPGARRGTHTRRPAGSASAGRPGRTDPGPVEGERQVHPGHEVEHQALELPRVAARMIVAASTVQKRRGFFQARSDLVSAAGRSTSIALNSPARTGPNPVVSSTFASK